jgi:hypothetical protein
MQDDIVALFAYDRWANCKLFDTFRQIAMRFPRTIADRHRAYVGVSSISLRGCKQTAKIAAIGEVPHCF